MGTRSKKNKRTMLTPRKLEEIYAEATGQMFLLACGYVMDELDYDADKICDFWAGLARYCEAVKDKTISMRKVCDIINANVKGANVRWNGRQ